MNMAQRIQTLRKEKGISQEELANALNISRQAVSKWESQQSLPDLDNIVALSIYFNVTTDYILKGTQTQIHTKKHIVLSKTLYMVSAALLFIGLLFTIFDWYEHVSMYAVLIGVVIQICGGICYGVATFVSTAKAHFLIKWCNTAFALFIPLAFLIKFGFGFILSSYSILLFDVVFFSVYILLAIGLYYFFKKRDTQKAYIK